jgi:GWxTD domain-containing protein
VTAGARTRWLKAGLALPVVASLSLPARAGQPPERAGVTSWADGPVRWLMTPEEMKRVRRLRTGREAIGFLEQFWRRRDPTPEDRANPFAEQFQQRVKAADHLYPEEGVRGSMTDRGRALVLLGPPPLLRYGQQEAPAWDRGHQGGRPVMTTRRIVIETWEYTPSDLPPDLTALLDGEPEVKLVFVAEEKRTYLVAGGRFLDLAAKAALRDEH